MNGFIYDVVYDHEKAIKYIYRFIANQTKYNRELSIFSFGTTMLFFYMTRQILKNSKKIDILTKKMEEVNRGD